MRWTVPLGWLAAGLAGLVLVGTGCDVRPHVDRYVAIGDSFSAGSGLRRIDPTSTWCQRSELSYPRLVAGELDAELTDVTCAGASTGSTTGAEPFLDGTSVPPQLDAVTDRTDLVTVGLGYNDDAYFSHLVYGCAQLAPNDPTGAPCQAAAAGQDLAASTKPTGEAVRQLLKAVHEQAPEAKVLLVGYPQLVPESGTCTDLPLAEGDYAYVREGLALLDVSLRRAAADADATYVDVWSASDGHDICAGDDAWVNGAVNKPDVAATYHPFERGQRAIADLVLDALGD